MNEISCVQFIYDAIRGFVSVRSYSIRIEVKNIVNIQYVYVIIMKAAVSDRIIMLNSFTLPNMFCHFSSFARNDSHKECK